MLRAAWHRFFHFQQAETPNARWMKSGEKMASIWICEWEKKEWVDVI